MKAAAIAALLLLAACAGPKPCTRTLCVAKLEGTMRLDGWDSSAIATAATPQPPVISDSAVTIIAGTAELRNGKTKVSAAEGTSFKFSVSTRAVASIEVSSGSVTVQPARGAPVAFGPGTTFSLPK